MTDASDAGPAQTLGRVRTALLARPTGAHVAIAALCGLLAFGLVTQAHLTASGGALASTRASDLVGILADLESRADRLRPQVADLQQTAANLANGSTRDAAALAEAKQRAETLGILTGTLAARGPGIVLVVTDPRRSAKADTLLDAVEELRDAGAEALQLSGVRVVASTALLDDPAGGVDVDGQRVVAPYRLVAIGDPRTLAGALTIPGGVVDTVDAQPGATALITQSPAVTVAALRPLDAPRYARPTSPAEIKK
jgi:uncharacterized protein YlxW (UPF0749 family)